jgi:tetratricopeptide (TPR) repeat protein
VLPADIAAERARFAQIAANRLRLSAPVGAPRSWETSRLDPARVKAVETAYAKLIAADPKNSGYLTGRATFFTGTRDHRRAIADLTAALAIDADAGTYFARSQARHALGDYAGAAADAGKAAELAPGGETAAMHAQYLGLAGQAAAGLPLVEGELARNPDDKPRLTAIRAELLARLGRADEGLAALAALMVDRPGDRITLNYVCWHEALWQVGRERMAQDCDAAVNAADFAPDVIDSRALAHLRLGKLDAALADSNAALGRAPGQDQTLLLRGIILTRMGDAKGGAADLAEALRRRPGLKSEYVGYGLLPA